MSNEDSYSYAGFWKRAAAFIIDGFLLEIIVYLYIIIYELTPQIVNKSEYDTISTWVIVTILLNWVYQGAMESSSKQATLGKLSLGIIVTDLSGERITFAKASGRHFGQYLSLLILGIGFLMAGFTQQKKALHDMMAKCLVINKA